MSLLIQLRSCRLSDVNEKVKDFAAKLSLVPIPPPGHLHLVCSELIEKKKLNMFLEHHNTFIFQLLQY